MAVTTPATPMTALPVDVARAWIPVATDYFPIGLPESHTPQAEAIVYNDITQLPGWFIQAIDEQYGDLFGTELAALGRWNGGMEQFYALDAMAARSTGMTADATNVQVEGVDEADLVESDGDYLYLLADGRLTILDMQGKQPEVTAEVDFNGRAVGMYLSGDRLTIVEMSAPLYDPWGWSDLRFSYDRHRTNKTTVTVLDVDDRATPRLVERTELDGRLVASRMVDGKLRLVLASAGGPLASLPGPQMVSSGQDSETGATIYSYETRDAYLAHVLKLVRETQLAGYRQLAGVGSGNQVHYESLDERLRGMINGRNHAGTVIAAFNAMDDESGPDDVMKLKGFQATTVYATADHLYLAGHEANDDYDGKLTIHKVGFAGRADHLKLVATGQVDGALINQFAMDEHEGRLRVVTETWGRQSLFVLQQQGKTLQAVGVIDNLAPGERLYAVRFVGEHAFAVTFRRVDPLFAIDLSDPTAPVVAGELKIPGYSEYLQPMGGGFLLSIGRGADEATGLFQELQASIFDVSDLNEPQLAHRYSFAGGRGTASITTGDRWQIGDLEHHAVGYFAEAGLLALPVHSESHGLKRMGDNEFGAVGGLQVLRVDAATGFAEAALIEHDSRILRSLVLGDRLVVVSGGTVSVHTLDDPAQELGRIKLSSEGATNVAELEQLFYFSRDEAVAIAAVAGGTDLTALAAASVAKAGDDARENATGAVDAGVTTTPASPRRLPDFLTRQSAMVDLFSAVDVDADPWRGPAESIETDWIQLD